MQGFAQGRISFDERPQRRGDEIGGGATGVGKQRQEVLLAEICVVGIASSERRSAERFQGRNGVMSSGAFPPAAATLQVPIEPQAWVQSATGHGRKREKSIAAKRPAHREPEP